MVRIRVCVIDRVLVSVNVPVPVILVYSSCEYKSCVCDYRVLVSVKVIMTVPVTLLQSRVNVSVIVSSCVSV